MKTIKKIFGTVLTLVIGFFLGWVFTGDKEKSKDWLVRKITKLLYGEECEVKPRRTYYTPPRYSSYVNAYNRYRNLDSDPRVHEYYSRSAAESVVKQLMSDIESAGWSSVSNLTNIIEAETKCHYTYHWSYCSTGYGWTHIGENTLQIVRNQNGMWLIRNWPDTVTKPADWDDNC